MFKACLGMAGDVCGITRDRTEGTLRNHPVGDEPGVCSCVKTSGTTAENIVVLSWARFTLKGTCHGIGPRTDHQEVIP